MNLIQRQILNMKMGNLVKEKNVLTKVSKYLQGQCNAIEIKPRSQYSTGIVKAVFNEIYVLRVSE